MISDHPVPFVSVILSACDTSPFLEEAVQSILDQSFKNFEFLIMNDGASTSVSEVLALFSDSRIRVFSSEVKRGLAASLNELLKYAKGDLIARMDADDVSNPNRFKIQTDILNKHPELVMVGSWAILMDALGTETGIIKLPVFHGEILFESYCRNPFVHPTVMMRHKTLQKLNGPYDARFIYSQDYDLFLRILNEGQTINIPIPLLKYRIHAGQVSERKREEQITFHFLAIQKMIENLELKGGPADLLRSVHADSLNQVRRSGQNSKIRLVLYHFLKQQKDFCDSPDIQQYVWVTYFRELVRERNWPYALKTFLLHLVRNPLSLRFVFMKNYQTKKFQKVYLCQNVSSKVFSKNSSMI